MPRSSQKASDERQVSRYRLLHEHACAFGQRISIPFIGRQWRGDCLASLFPHPPFKPCLRFSQTRLTDDPLSKVTHLRITDGSSQPMQTLLFEPVVRQHLELKSLLYSEGVGRSRASRPVLQPAGVDFPRARSNRAARFSALCSMTGVTNAAMASSSAASGSASIRIRHARTVL